MPKGVTRLSEAETAGAEGDRGPGRIERTRQGWRVCGAGGTEEVPDLLNAMVLADLLLAEDGASSVERAAPPRAGADATELERLRVTVAQLEHALHTRVVVEQAIGVLAERHHIPPRSAFELLRGAARSRGRKVAELAGCVISSSTDPTVAVPTELARPHAEPRVNSL